MRGMPHYAVFWKRVGTDDDARPTVSNVAEQVRCRWDQTRRTVTGPDGHPVAVDATASVDRPVPVGSYMWKGKTDDLPGTGQVPSFDLMEVITSESTDDWRGTSTEHEVTLARAGDALPTMVTDPEG